MELRSTPQISHHDFLSLELMKVTRGNNVIAFMSTKNKTKMYIVQEYTNNPFKLVADMDLVETWITADEASNILKENINDYIALPNMERPGTIDLYCKKTSEIINKDLEEILSIAYPKKPKKDLEDMSSIDPKLTEPINYTTLIKRRLEKFF